MNGLVNDLLSGRRRGAVPSLLRATLGAASLAYGLGVGWRNARYDRGEGVERAAVPVISIGNLTTGGTGKTPVVALVANHLRRWGVNVALLSRGYRALGNGSQDDPCGAPSLNDEALVLETLCPGVPHVQQVDRVAGAKLAFERHGADLLVLDDGFQHRRLARDLDIVLIDSTNPFGFGRLLPRGLLREPVDSLRRADLVMLTRADTVSVKAKAAIFKTIERVAPKLPIVEVNFPPVGLINASGERRDLESLEETPLLAFCGIGNPAGFAATLREAGLRPAELMPFADHHHYSSRDLERVSRRARACGVAAVVTTLKDLVKIDSDRLPAPSELPLWAVETRCEISSNEHALLDRLDELANRQSVGRAA